MLQMLMERSLHLEALAACPTDPAAMTFSLQSCIVDVHRMRTHDIAETSDAKWKAELTGGALLVICSSVYAKPYAAYQAAACGMSPDEAFFSSSQVVQILA